jgi:PAS domain S-box-containing protein
MNSLAKDLERGESTSAPEFWLEHTGGVFEDLFERSADAMWLYDPQTARLVDCNQAAVKLIGAENKQQLLRTLPEDLSPPLQPDGLRSSEKSAQIIALVEREQAHRFEWVIRRLDGREVPVEVSSTAMLMGGKTIHALVSRDISERKKAERELREMTHALERRVAERTAALANSEARFRALVEHAPEAIVVFDGDTGRLLFGNEHACRLYGVPMSALATLSPADVSPEFQPDGRRSVELAREKMDAALAGGTLVFEWTHQRPDGTLVPTEVRLLRLPDEGLNLIRASIIDNTESKRAQRALRESEEKFRALFEGSSQGVVLHDENQILEANPAAVRILGLQSPQELLGRHPSETSPPFQPGGESSAALARKYIQECTVNGSARFDWMSLTPQGREIPLEVTLTRIEWSGRQVIQALINDITERKQAEAEVRASEARLRESEARFSAAFKASPVFITISRLEDGRTVLANEAFLKWTGYRLEEVLGRNSLELGLWANPADREPFWEELRLNRFIHERECRVRNRHGKLFTMLLSADIIEVNHVPHLLTVGLDISLRKQAEAEFQASEARLRESEARFSAAFQASPALLGILRLRDGKYVLANDAHLNWLGVIREEVLGRTCLELGMWENPAERDLVLQDMQAFGAIRHRECRWLNRRGELFTILLSAETIQLNNEPHMLTMAVDITQRKRAEEELLVTLEREKELSQLKSSFVSMVSHEFRTPLGIIQSSAELLRDFHARMLPIEREEQLDSISRNARRMAGMMEEVLVLSRLDAGKLDFQPAPLDLNAFCRRVVDEVLSATNARCAIALSVAAIPLAPRADEQLLGHIFTNLLSNAVKYSEPGATVHFSLARDGRDAVCVIRDHGIGIAEDDQRQLFQAFHRGRNVGTRPGTGLGLLLVQRCAELHHGQVQLESKIGAGTTVTVVLPVF